MRGHAATSRGRSGSTNRLLPDPSAARVRSHRGVSKIDPTGSLRGWVLGRRPSAGAGYAESRVRSTARGPGRWPSTSDLLGDREVASWLRPAGESGPLAWSNARQSSLTGCSLECPRLWNASGLGGRPVHRLEPDPALPCSRPQRTRDRMDRCARPMGAGNRDRARAQCFRGEPVARPPTRSGVHTPRQPRIAARNGQAANGLRARLPARGPASRALSRSV